jgi:hypothetical protein
MPINPADGIMDEAAEQAAFVEAVMEWRRMGNSSKVIEKTTNEINR